jgi:C1A family cysteine protease
MKYGWKPDIPDKRDWVFAKLAAPIRGIPTKMDLRQFCSPVEDQGNLGSCTANALVGALEFLEIKDKVPFSDLSRLFVYYNERKIEGTTNTDSGAMLRDGIKALAMYGVCVENCPQQMRYPLSIFSNSSCWAYDIRKVSRTPPIACYTEGQKHKITAYARLNTLDDMRLCLSNGYPFVFGFSVYESFESDEVARTGMVLMPESGESVLGGHAVMGVGYDDAAQRFIVRNSWGSKWGLKGYFTMPYEYLADRNLSDDFWTVRRGNGF